MLSPVHAWTHDPKRSAWAPHLLLWLALAVLLLPFDGLFGRAVTHLNLGGDARRELEALQQYGQGLSSLLIAAVIWIQDPPRRRKLANWAAAFIVAFAVVTLTKTILGRPRPKYDDPWVFLGPFGQYPVDGAGVRHAWEFWTGISSDLWSMPSSHTAYGVVMAVFVGASYPRLRWLVYLVAALVGLGRILTHAHYPSDVAAGWAIGSSIAAAAVAGRWGERVLNARAGRHDAAQLSTTGTSIGPSGTAQSSAAGRDPTAARGPTPQHTQR